MLKLEDLEVGDKVMIDEDNVDTGSLFYIHHGKRVYTVTEVYYIDEARTTLDFVRCIHGKDEMSVYAVYVKLLTKGPKCQS